MREDLAAEGWTRRSVASEPRLGEAVALYAALGYEVRLVPLCEDGGDGEGEAACTACYAADPDPGRHRVIYTRPAGDREGEKELP